MATIAHISDLHILKVAGSSPFSFLNKRATGGVNLLIGRAHRHRVEIVRQALEQIRELNVDHLVVTGDITNLSLPTEFELAAEILQSHGSGKDVSVVPGNHDNYTRGAARNAV